MTRTVAFVTLTFAAMITALASPLTAQTPDTCNRAAMADMIGQPTFYVVNVVYEIAEYAPEQVVRLLRPGQEPGFVRPNRMTVLLDDDGLVAEVYCG